MTEGEARPTPRSKVAQTRRHVDAVPDVVVALHQDDLTHVDARADGDGLDRTGDDADDIVQLQDGLEQRPGLDAHRRHAVAQPLRDPHPAPGADVAEHARKAVRMSTARSSPSSSVSAVNPDTSTKAKLRWTRTSRCCHAARGSSPIETPTAEAEPLVGGGFLPLRWAHDVLAPW